MNEPVGPIHYTLDPESDTITFNIFGEWLVRQITQGDAVTTVVLERP